MSSAAEQKRITARRLRKSHRVRNKVRGTPERPRLSVFRSSKHIYAQVIDDLNGNTLACAGSNSKEFKAKLPNGGNIQAAAEIGQVLAEKARAAGVTQVAFDRGHYKYHGRIKALADAVRAAGIQF